MNKVNVGVVGCGNISEIYFQNLTQVFKNITIYACADLQAERASLAAEKWDIKHIMTLDDMLTCHDIHIILNLTTPKSHYKICKMCLEAGKHVYVEKPLSLSFEEGKELVEIANKKGLLLGCAPDTFMGAGIQTCRKLIDDGYIGEPIAAVAFMLCHGHESWHPDPEFYYEAGAGPMFDMGPYYLTALLNLMGGVREVCGMNETSFSQRMITSAKKYGKTIDVETDTHVSGLLRFENGAVASIVTSFDVWDHTLPHIEIYGTKGSIKVPDPNSFGGPVLISTQENKGFKEIPLTHIYSENSRGIGLSNMASCIKKSKKNMASGDLALHVLEIMCALKESEKTKKYYEMTSKLSRPEPVSRNIIKGIV